MRGMRRVGRVMRGNRRRGLAVRPGTPVGIDRLDGGAGVARSSMTMTRRVGAGAGAGGASGWGTVPPGGATAGIAAAAGTGSAGGGVFGGTSTAGAVGGGTRSSAGPSSSATFSSAIRALVDARSASMRARMSSNPSFGCSGARSVAVKSFASVDRSDASVRRGSTGGTRGRITVPPATAAAPVPYPPLSHGSHLS